MLQPTSYTRVKSVRLRDDSGALADPDAGADPSIAVYNDGVLISPTVTWTKIATGIWRYSYTTPATVGNVEEYINATISAAAMPEIFREYFVASFDVPGPFKGTGGHRITVTVTDANETPLEGATVKLLEGISGYAQTTDASGEAKFDLDPATYEVTITKAGYRFDPDQTHVVSADPETHEVTFEMTQEVVIPSADPELTTAYITIRDSAGDPVPDQELVVQLVEPTEASGAGWRRNRVSATTDENGLAQLALLRGATYEISIGGRVTTPGQFTTSDSETYAIAAQLGYKENA